MAQADMQCALKRNPDNAAPEELEAPLDLLIKKFWGAGFEKRRGFSF